MEQIELYNALFKHYGPQHWWPVTEPGHAMPSYKRRSSLSEKQTLEICLGAILAQNTDWGNVMKALENLHKAGMMDCGKIAQARQSRVASLIKPSGYYNQKAKKLKEFCRHIQKNYGGKLEALLSRPLPELRQELLSLHGVGNETADDIILYAAGLPSFVIDAYTMRFAERFYGKKFVNYGEAKQFFEKQLPHNAGLFNEFHALLVEHGKRYCRKKPLCEKCFLMQYCEFPRQK